MKTTIKEKKIDAVKIMRNIRNKISEETQEMSYKELREYIDNRLKAKKLNLI